MTIDEYTNAVAGKKAMAFSRWGDGEWIAVLRRRPPNKANCDGHKYFEDMGEALRNVLRSKPDYALGMQKLALRLVGDQIRGWLSREGLSDLAWVNSEIFDRRASSGDWSWSKVFMDSDYVLVGPEHLKRVFDSERMVVVPSRNCWLEREDVMARLRHRLADGRWRAVGFCSGMPSNVWIDDIRREFPGNAYIDFGSVFDFKAGVRSRGWHRKQDKTFVEVI